MSPTYVLALLVAASSPNGDMIKDPSAREIDLGGKINSWLQQNEDSSSWSEDQRHQAEAMTRAQLDLFTVCIGRGRDRLKDSKEQVETIITAIFGSCQSEEAKLRRVLTLMFRGLLPPDQRADKADELIAETRKKDSEALAAYLVEYRLKR